MGPGDKPCSAGENAYDGFPFGSYTTFYDLRRNSSLPIGFPGPASQGPCTVGTRLNFIGDQFDSLGPSCEGFWWFNTKETALPAGFELPQVDHPRSDNPQSSNAPSPTSSETVGTGEGNQGVSNVSAGGLSSTDIIAIAVAGGAALASESTSLLTT